MTTWICCLAIAGGQSAAASEEKPRALSAVEHARKALVQADVDWTMTYNVRSRSTHSYRTRIAFDTSILTCLGDENGVVAYDTRGDTVIVGPDLFLDDVHGTWEYQPGKVTARLRPQKSNEQIDIRCIGLLPRYSSHTRSPDAICSYPETVSGRTYQQERRNGLEVVEATVGKDHKIIWHIDIEKGSNPVHVEERVNDQMIGECKSTLREFGGVWFPSKVEYYSPRRSEPIHVIEVTHAVLRGKDLPRRFVPEDIGIEAGLTLEVQDGGGMKCWSGDDVVSMDDFYADVKAGRKKLGPTVAKIQAELKQARMEGRQVDLRMPVIEVKHVDAGPGRGTENKADAPIMTRSVEDAWTKYTRDFIQANALSETQAASALSVLEDCLKAATAVSGRVRTAGSKAGSSSQTVPATTQSAAAARKLNSESDALDRIFNKQLVPRLEGLLTQDQRTARNEREKKSATSKPS